MQPTGLSETLSGFLEDPVGDAFVVVEAGELTKASSLRKLFEGVKAAGAIECYDDKPEDTARLIRETLEGLGGRRMRMRSPISATRCRRTGGCCAANLRS